MKPRARISEIRKVIRYDDMTGILYWKVSNGSGVKSGDIVGCICPQHNYWITNYKGKMYRVHNICWALYYGKWPKNIIDHIDGNKLNNRIVNLRDVTFRDNNRNMPRHRLGFHHGTTFLKRTKKWQAYARIKNNIKIHLGTFDTEKEAIKTYLEFTGE